MVLRALRFLETLIQRDDAQKVAFLKDLAQLWPQCDSRVLRCAPDVHTCKRTGHSDLAMSGKCLISDPEALMCY